MPAGPRIRTNNVFGITTDNPLTAGATSFNSAGLANLAVVASAHAIITLDPLRQFGAPEIIVVTVHTSSATVATITRGAYGTTARSHPQGTTWVHAPVTEDVTSILTSSTRPSDPYRGEMLFETDTNNYTARDVNDSWEHVLHLGQWQTYVPTVTGLTLGASTILARYIKIGRFVQGVFRVTLGAGFNFAAEPRYTLPVAMGASHVSESFMSSVLFLDIGSAVYGGFGEWDNVAGNVLVRGWNTNVTSLIFAAITNTSPFTWVNGDVITTNFTYESAT